MPTKMYDLGEKMSDEPVGVKGKKEKYYPDFYIGPKEIPELEDYEAGDKIIFTIEAMVRSKTENATGKDSMSIEMRKARIENTKPIRERSYNTGLSIKDQKEVEGKK